MVFGIGLIFLLQWVFLGNLRSAIIVGTTIPFALFFAVGILVMRGESANLLSVGAIDFGLIVDATVIMVESIFRRLGHASARPDGFAGERAVRLQGKLAAIFRAGIDVNRSTSSRPASSSRASYRCSRSAESRGTSSARWQRPMPTRWRRPDCDLHGHARAERRAAA